MYLFFRVYTDTLGCIQRNVKYSRQHCDMKNLTQMLANSQELLKDLGGRNVSLCEIGKLIFHQDNDHHSYKIYLVFRIYTDTLVVYRVMLNTS